MGRSVRVDAAFCQGAGNCEYVAPRTFALGRDRKATVIDPEGDPFDRIERAAEQCPAMAITIDED